MNFNVKSFIYECLSSKFISTFTQDSLNCWVCVLEYKSRTVKVTEIILFSLVLRLAFLVSFFSYKIQSSCISCKVKLGDYLLEMFVVYVYVNMKNLVLRSNVT